MVTGPSKSSVLVRNGPETLQGSAFVEAVGLW